MVGPGHVAVLGLGDDPVRMDNGGEGYLQQLMGLPPVHLQRDVYLLPVLRKGEGLPDGGVAHRAGEGGEGLPGNALLPHAPGLPDRIFLGVLHLVAPVVAGQLPGVILRVQIPVEVQRVGGGLQKLPPVPGQGQ